MQVPYNLTETTITVYIDGDANTVPRDWHGWEHMKQLLQQPNHDVVAIRNHIGGYDPTTLDRAFTVSEDVDISDIVIDRRGVYYQGQKVTTKLAQRMLDVQQEGLPLDPWLKFMAKVYANPADYARAELYDWLERSDLPITEDGDFLAFKRVQDNGEGATPRYVDLYTKSINNSPGEVVQMDRQDVDVDRHRTCSAGLHFCSKSYLPHFGTASSNTTLLVKVNPADVVSIPSDYNNTKGRTWRYEVLQAIPDTVDVQAMEWTDPVISEPAEEGGDWVIFVVNEGETTQASSATRSRWQRVKDWWVGS